MTTVLESAVSNFLDKNGVGSSAGAATAREFIPLGLNAQKVVSKRYSLKDENGEPIETWEDIVRRVVGHVSAAETEPLRRRHFYSEMTSVML
ncbi:MAG TPA: ribonucleotide reductase N-terminal alpha domain-containing protein, partial [Pyrinomonadaceae bacterium]|nr:ribonucleotide reductase N-terminal alpha domain-containing protein [Pyrinomonadaceae bacterium]